MRKCSSCNCSIENRHKNARRCVSCAKLLRKSPAHNLTPLQQKKALELAGKMYRNEIAKTIGCSRTAFTRFAKQRKDVNWNAHRYKDELVEKVVNFYINNSMHDTQKKFQNVCVRSIIDRYVGKVKCIPWSEKETLALYKYTGLASYTEIAVKLGRNPCAPKRKRAKQVSGYVNSIPFDIAKKFVTRGCPFYYLRKTDKPCGHWTTPWVAMVKHLRAENPGWVNDAVASLAKFQRWLHGSEAKIYEILEGKI